MVLHLLLFFFDMVEYAIIVRECSHLAFLANYGVFIFRIHDHDVNVFLVRLLLLLSCVNIMRRRIHSFQID